MTTSEYIGIALLIGLLILCYKTWDFWKQRNELREKLNKFANETEEFANNLETAAKDIQQTDELKDDMSEALIQRQIYIYKSYLETTKATTKGMPIAKKKDIAHKIARDTVHSVTENKIALSTENKHKLAYYKFIFPGIKIDDLNADLDTNELVEIIEQYILKKIS